MSTRSHSNQQQPPVGPGQSVKPQDGGFESGPPRSHTPNVGTSLTNIFYPQQSFQQHK